MVFANGVTQRKQRIGETGPDDRDTLRTLCFLRREQTALAAGPAGDNRKGIRRDAAQRHVVGFIARNLDVQYVSHRRDDE